MVRLSKLEKQFLETHRVGRLATVDPSGHPLVVPICYACDGECVYSVMDKKPKRVPVERLKRVRNIRANPSVSLVIDDYSEDWTDLRYLIINGSAEIILGGGVHSRAIELLRRKYPQYAQMALDEAPVIKITPLRVITWGRCFETENPAGKGTSASSD